MIPIANPDVGDEGKKRVQDVLDGGMLADGPEVREFESEFADYCGAERGVATSNGTTALHAALEALGIGDGDRVLTSPFSFVASANAIRFAGADPVFADIDPETYNLDSDAVESVVTKEDVDAIVAVHLYGLPAAMDRLTDIADRHNLALVEDAAQAHGASLDGQRVGSFGDAACFSFYPTKNMTTGEGGMITTDRENVADRAAQFVNHGRNDEYEHERLGHNFRMTSVAAAIGRAQLERLPDFTEKRRANARRLTEGLADTPVTTPTEPPGRRHVYHQYTVRVDDREAFRDHMDEQGVGTSVYYPKPIHKQSAYESNDQSLPAAEAAAREVVSLPVHPGVDGSDARKIISAVEAFTKHGKLS